MLNVSKSLLPEEISVMRIDSVAVVAAILYIRMCASMCNSNVSCAQAFVIHFKYPLRCHVMFLYHVDKRTQS